MPEWKDTVNLPRTDFPMKAGLAQKEPAILAKWAADDLYGKLRAARADAATGLLDIKRLGEMLSRIKGRIVHKALDRVSPLAVPVMLEIGRESVYGEAADELLAEAADELVKEAMG